MILRCSPLRASFALALFVFSCFIAAPTRAQEQAPAAGADAAAELAKKLSNPVASLISFPIQMNFDYGQGAGGDGYKFVTNVQPVVPITLSKDWNVISRTILPLACQSHIVGSGSQGGLGDILQSLFFSPKEPTKESRARIEPWSSSTCRAATSWRRGSGISPARV